MCWFKRKKPKHPYYKIAKKEIGVKEVAGEEHSPRILEYHSTTLLRANRDEVPWCSAFVNWCVLQCGINGTNDAMARSWLDWGEELKQPEPGCIVVLWRKRRDSVFGHVGFYVAHDDENVFILGGNQGNRVCIKPYALNYVLGYRGN